MHAALRYYYLDPSVQETELAQAIFSRVSWYEKNIKLLCCHCPYFDCLTPHSWALADALVGGMLLDDLVARFAIRPAARLAGTECRITSQMHPRFYFLSPSRAPCDTGNGVFWQPTLPTTPNFPP